MAEQQPDLARLWKWGMHEDNLFRQRLAFTALAEAILIAAVVQLLKQDSMPNVATLILALMLVLLGLGFTIFILYGQIRLGGHIQAVVDLIGEMEGENGTYRTIRRRIPQNHNLRKIETYWPACMFLVLWLIFLVATLSILAHALNLSRC